MTFKLNTSEKAISICFSFLIFQKFFLILGFLDNNFVNPTSVLEFLILYLTAKNFGIRNLTISLIIFLLASILIFTLLSAIKNNIAIFEAIRATKWIFYIICLLSIKNKKPISHLFLVLQTKIILFFTLIVYLATVIQDGLHSRPYLLTENNYEIAMFSGLIILILHINSGFGKHFDQKWLLIHATIIFLSGSRSGSISLLIVIIFTLRQKKNPITIVNILKILPFFLILLYIFDSRQSSLYSIDRFQFLQTFLREMTLKNPITWVITNFQLKPISMESCYSLKFYSSLFSDINTFTCFSVIFHSFFLRVIYDFGFVGLILAFLPSYVVIKNNLTKNLAIYLSLLSITNSLSVSGPNNPYVIFPYICALLIVKIKKISDN